MFNVGDKVAHPMHGAGVIDRIVSLQVDGVTREYYLFRMLSGALEMKIPVGSCHIIGLRAIISREQAQQLLNQLPDMEVEMTANWNQRYRENVQRVKSGDLLEVAWVMKGLVFRDRQSSLSTGERKLLRTAKQILLSELALALENEYATVEESLCRAMMGETVLP